MATNTAEPQAELPGDPPLPQPRAGDERIAQIITLAQSVDVTLSENAETIAAQAAEIERLEEIIASGGDGGDGGTDPEEPPIVIPPGQRKPDVYFLPEATGDASGKDPANAKAYSTLAATVGSVGPDKVLGLIGDRGSWKSVPGTALSKGGAEGKPIVIMGCDGAGAPYQIVMESGRPAPLPFLDPNKYTGGSGDTISMPRSEWAQGAISGGATLFTCNKGADFLSFKYFKGRNIGSFAYYGADVKGHTYDRIDLFNVKHGWWMSDDPAAGSTTEKCIQQMLWENITVDFFDEDCFRWRGTSHHLTVRHFDLNSRRIMGHITFGFNIGTGDTARNDKVTDWTIQDGKIRNCHDTHYEKPWCDSPPTYDSTGKAKGQSYAPLPGKVRDPKVWKGDMPGTDYWNGDGISAERNCNRGLVEDVEISGCTDAGADCKAGEVTFRRVHFFDNKRNFRLYAPGLRMEQCTSDSVHKRGGSGGPAHVYLKGSSATGGKGAELVLDKCTFRGGPSNAFSYESEFKYGIKVSGHQTCTYEGCTGNPPPYVP